MQIDRLIRQCKRGDLAAQEELYRLFSPKLFGVSLKYCRNYAEAEDNLQESFITILKKIKQFEGRGSFEGWMKRIVINKALQNYRKQQVFDIIDEAALRQPEEVEVEEGQLSLDFLLQIIQELPDRYRLVFNLYVLDDYSHQEIGEMLGIAEGTSKSNLARARQHLKDKIEASQDKMNFRNPTDEG